MDNFLSQKYNIRIYTYIEYTLERNNLCNVHFVMYNFAVKIYTRKTQSHVIVIYNFHFHVFQLFSNKNQCFHFFIFHFLHCTFILLLHVLIKLDVTILLILLKTRRVVYSNIHLQLKILNHLYFLCTSFIKLLVSCS